MDEVPDSSATGVQVAGGAAAGMSFALLWRGDREARDTATAGSGRLQQVFGELAALGVHAEPAVYSDDIM